MDLTKKLKNVPEGTTMYSPLFKDPITFVSINEGAPYPIICKTIVGELFVFTEKGYYTKETAPQNCMLFPTPEMTWKNYHYIKDKQLVAVSINGKYTYIGCVKGGFYTTSTICYWRINLTTGFVENNTGMPCSEIISDEDIPLINELINDKGYIIGDNSLIKIFKKGDIIVSDTGIIALFDSIRNSSRPDTIVYQAIRRINGEIIVKTDTGIGYASNASLASNKEKDLFFASLSEAGYEFDGVSVKHKEYQFEPFEQVLVRDSFNEKWKTSHYSHREGTTYIAGGTWLYCIPYNEETKHLRGTSLDAPKKYK